MCWRNKYRNIIFFNLAAFYAEGRTYYETNSSLKKSTTIRFAVNVKIQSCLYEDLEARTVLMTFPFGTVDIFLKMQYKIIYTNQLIIKNGVISIDISC